MRSSSRTSSARSFLLTWTAGAAAACAGQVGCWSASSSSAEPSLAGTTSSADISSDSGAEATAEATGAIDVTAQWTLPGDPGDEQLSQLAWTLTQTLSGTERSQQGTVNVTASPATFVIAQVQPGGSYSLTIASTSTDGATVCNGSASVRVQGNRTTNVTVPLACMSAVPDAGYALVNATIADCATVSSASALPAEVNVGFPVALSALAIAPDPAGVTYAWSAPSGIFSAPTSANTSFTCTAAGMVPVTLTVGDGPLPEGSTCDPALSTATLVLACD
jgi:hypothetical protein